MITDLVASSTPDVTPVINRNTVEAQPGIPGLSRDIFNVVAGDNKFARERGKRLKAD